MKQNKQEQEHDTCEIIIQKYFIAKKRKEKKQGYDKKHTQN
jgi:hypothetical protein